MKLAHSALPVKHCLHPAKTYLYRGGCEHNYIGSMPALETSLQVSSILSLEMEFVEESARGIICTVCFKEN